MRSGLRNIEEIIYPREVDESGVEVNRYFGYPELNRFDPFLLMDELHLNDAQQTSYTIPDHPSRGVETVSYLLYGSLDYADAAGHGTLKGGGCRWVNSAGGIVHRENPRRGAGEFWGIHLWINLPEEEKYGPGKARVFDTETIPVHRGNDGVITRIIAGEYEGILGPGGRYPENTLLLDISIPPLTSLQLEIPAAYRVLVSALEGNKLCDLAAGTRIQPASLVRYGPGDSLALCTEEDESRLLLLAGRPIHEPVAWDGTIVMCDRPSLLKAKNEAGTLSFGRYRD